MNRATRRLTTPHIRTRRLVDPLNAGGGLNAHRLVATVAVDMANVLCEEYFRVNSIYHAMRAQGRVTEAAARKLFVERVAPKLLEDARRALVDKMAHPDTPPAMADEISEALILDSDLRGKRTLAEANAVMPSGMMH